MDDALHHLQLLGISPIITHPERNRLICSQPDRLRRWLHQGCTVQITAQSLLGRWGEGTKKQVEEWIDQEMVHFFASDAHNTTQRPLRLRRGIRHCRAALGRAAGAALFRDNPLAAFEGRPLPYEPETARSRRTDRLQPLRRKRFIFF